MITQKDRLLEIFTPLDNDTLLLERFNASERLSQPFRYDLTLLADVDTNMHKQVKPDELVGETMSVRLQLASGNFRYFNGVVARFTQEHEDHRFAYYRAELVPWTWMLTLTSDCRIFQGKSVPDVVTQVLEDNGFATGQHFRWKLGREYKVWDYCVQHRETDYHFISRLLEEEGIFYYFEHDDEQRHVLMLTDSFDFCLDCPDKAEYLFESESGVGEREDTVTNWEVRRQLVSGKWALRDFHFEMPRNPQEVADITLDAPATSKNMERFDYPGKYAHKFNRPEERLDEVKPEGERSVRNRVEQEETRRLGYTGLSTARALTPGYRIRIDGLHHEAESQQYVLESVDHTVLQHPGYISHLNERARLYHNNFACMASDVNYRPARVTPKPIAYGPQSAFVIEDHDPPQEEIWPDKFGRVKVRFPWDREAKYACWIRVVQQWASKGFGFQWIPRVGDEVLVGFVDGDPDCPVILGSLYNKENMPPFDLPDNKTQSGIKTNSSPEGGSEDYNMLRFEDKKGEEEVHLHAQKQLKTVVEQDEIRIVGANRTTEVEENDVLTVKKGDRQATLEKGSDGLDVKLGGITITAPVGTYKLDAMQVEITGTATIKLTCGASTIEMTPGLITISAPMVKIN